MDVFSYGQLSLKSNCRRGYAHTYIGIHKDHFVTKGKETEKAKKGSAEKTGRKEGQEKETPQNKFLIETLTATRPVDADTSNANCIAVLFVFASATSDSCVDDDGSSEAFPTGLR